MKCSMAKADGPRPFQVELCKMFMPTRVKCGSIRTWHLVMNELYVLQYSMGVYCIGPSPIIKGSFHAHSKKP